MGAGGIGKEMLRREGASLAEMGVWRELKTGRGNGTCKGPEVGKTLGVFAV